MTVLSGFRENTTDINNIYLTKEKLLTSYVALKNNHLVSTLWMWGAATTGRLGDNTTTAKSSPVQTIATGTNWKQVAAGWGHGACIRGDNSLWLWGTATNGALGTNNTTNTSSPVQTVTGGSNWAQVACGNQYTAAIKTDGSLWLWGRNVNGGLGDGSSVTDRSSPIQTVTGGSNWAQVACGSVHTAAIKTDKTLWLWGYNGVGQLGNNSATTAFSSPVQTVAGGANWAQVACGTNNTAAIKTDGTLWTWGAGGSGQLGDGTFASKSSPVQTSAGGSNWNQVSVGTEFMGAIKTDGTLWMWGRNQNGQLGDGSTSARNSPVQTSAGGSNWMFVSCGDTYTLALTRDGKLWVWGNNDVGQLGDNTRTSYSSPVQSVNTDRRWIQVSASGDSTATANISGGIRELSNAVING